MTGNEISSPDAGLLTAYHLLAAVDDPLVNQILAETLTVIVPTQNPDGRDRFVHQFEVAYGIEPAAHPLAAEHDEPWPGGRTNHYYFDLNRDWLTLTQPETRGHVAAYFEWFPQIFVDLHETGGNFPYYFAPEAVPYNPHIPSQQRESLEIFGLNNAKWFDRYGFLYFTREVYDAFYPGYGASWPLFHGSIATTYEQASARGLVFRRSDDTDLRFRDGVRHHFETKTSKLPARRLRRDLGQGNKSASRTAPISLLRDDSFQRSRRTAVSQKGDGEKNDVSARILEGCFRAGAASIHSKPLVTNESGRISSILFQARDGQPAHLRIGIPKSVLQRFAIAILRAVEGEKTELTYGGRSGPLAVDVTTR